MIVVDASAALMGLFDDGDARRMLQSEDLHVPALVDSEIANTLRRREQAGLLGTEEAARALGVWRMLGVRRYFAVGLLGRMWELRHNSSAYDATYVALAEALGCDLLTADSGLTRAPRLPCSVRLVSS